VTAVQPVHHYSVADARKGLLRHAAASYRYPHDAWRARVLLWNFLRRSLLGRFRGSALGAVWVLVHPVFQFAVYFTVFGVLFSSRDLASEGPDPLFAVYLFSGILIFGAIQESATAGLSSVLANGNLVKKVAFPCELLPLTPVLVAACVYMVGCAVLIAVGVAAGQVVLGWGLLAWPVLVAALALFCTGLGMLLGAANVFVRDIAHIWGIAVTAWFFLSPVFWRPPLVTQKLADAGFPGAVDLLVLNPAYSFLLAQRQVFGIGGNLPADAQAELYPHDLGTSLMFCVAWAAATFVLGYGFFMSRRHKFADLV
jgi:ABC-type polysaccharide/polyol phosphate export permease